jgi:CysZ protein
MATAAPTVRRPGFLVRAAEGAWHVPAGFVFLLRNPGLLPWALLPAALTAVLLAGGVVLGLFLGPPLERRLTPGPGQAPAFVQISMSLLVWSGAVVASVVLAFGLALLLMSPILDQLSRRVEARAHGQVIDRGRGFRWEVWQSVRGSFFFLAAAPGVFLLGLVPFAGPVLAALWGAYALAFQLTDSTLSRRGLTFADKRAWHRRWRVESEGFGLAGLVTLLVPFANLLLAPAMTAGATLLVVELESLGGGGAPAAAASGAAPVALPGEGST